MTHYSKNPCKVGSKLQDKKYVMVEDLDEVDCIWCKKKNGYFLYSESKVKTKMSDDYREKTYRKNFGIGISDYEKMAEKQGGVCAICGNIGKKRLSVDHDHKTGKVRGLLCQNCNYAIGFLKDDVALVSRAISYLQNSLECQI